MAASRRAKTSKPTAAKSKVKADRGMRPSAPPAQRTARKAKAGSRAPAPLKTLDLSQGVDQLRALPKVLKTPARSAVLNIETDLAPRAATSTSPAAKRPSEPEGSPARRSPSTGKRSTADQAHTTQVARQLLQLQATLRFLRLQREAKSSADTVVLRHAAKGIDDGENAHAVAALEAVSQDRPGKNAGRARAEPARLEVVRRLVDSLVVKARPATLMAIRHARPGLKMFAATYAYPQRMLPLGDELDAAQIQVAVGGQTRPFALRLLDIAGQPVAGVKVRALVNWEGAHLSAVSDSQGIARFALPTVYPEVVILMVEPEHSYWSLYLQGFKAADAPQGASATLRGLLPDAFKLLHHYARYDPDAGQGVTVGVIDSGVGPHVDLTVAGGACLVTGEPETDFADNGIGHGTHVAGIIAARRSAGGTYGVAPAVHLRAYRVCPQTGNKGRASSVDIAAAIEKAVADGCDLINISMGSVEAMPEVPQMLERARAAGAVVVAATGNDGVGLLRYPARYSHTLAVAALGRDGTFPADSPVATQEGEVRRKSEWVAVFSNYGMGTDFIGPGVAVLSTFPGDRFAMMSGTSMATPFTTGMAARLLSANPTLLNMPRGPERADAIIQMMMDNVRRPGWADAYGFGVLK